MVTAWDFICLYSASSLLRDSIICSYWLITEVYLWIWANAYCWFWYASLFIPLISFSKLAIRPKTASFTKDKQACNDESFVYLMHCSKRDCSCSDFRPSCFLSEFEPNFFELLSMLAWLLPLWWLATELLFLRILGFFFSGTNPWFEYLRLLSLRTWSYALVFMSLKLSSVLRISFSIDCEAVTWRSFLEV